MALGLGTGSTAKHVINRISELLRQGTPSLAPLPRAFRIPLSDIDSYPIVYMAIDDADEVDPFLNLFKCHGGSLLRERMVGSACKKFIVIADESNLVNYVGGSGLAMPVKVIQFCWKFTTERLRKLFKEAKCVAKLSNFGEKEEP